MSTLLLLPSPQPTHRLRDSRAPQEPPGLFEPLIFHGGDEGDHRAPEGWPKEQQGLCVHVCVSLGVCVHTWMCVCTWVCVCMDVCVHMGVRVSMDVCAWVSVHMDVCVRTWMGVCACVLGRVCTHMDVCVCVHWGGVNTLGCV